MGQRLGPSRPVIARGKIRVLVLGPKAEAQGREGADLGSVTTIRSGTAMAKTIVSRSCLMGAKPPKTSHDRDMEGI